MIILLLCITAVSIRLTTTIDESNVIKSESATIVVPDDYPTIQEAINAANMGDTIYVRSGVYYEKPILNKTVNLIGENKETTVIDANYSGTVITVTAERCTIRDFTIRNSGTNNWAILIKAYYIVIENNVILHTYHGIGRWTEEGAYVYHCIIKGNKFIDNHCSIAIYIGYNNTILSNNISSQVSNCVGVVLHTNCHHNLIKQNNFYVNPSLQFVLWPSYNTIIENNFWGSFSLGRGYEGGGHDNVIYHNNFFTSSISAYPNVGENYWDNGYPSGGNYWKEYNGSDNYAGPFQNQTGYDGIGDVPYVVFDENNTDRYPLIHPYGSIVNVNTTSVFLTIQSAISATETLDGHMIFVKQGTYLENIVINKSIKLLGENRFTTIIKSRIRANYGYNAHVIRIISDEVSVDNFTITGAGGPPSSGDDAGILLYYVNNVRISHNIFIADELGVYIYYSLNVVVEENTFENCETGVFAQRSTYCIIRHNNMVHNKFGIYLYEYCQNNLILKNNLFENELGIHTYYWTDNNVIRCNNVSHSQEVGIWLLGENNIIAQNNIIMNEIGVKIWLPNSKYYHNNFLNNTQQVQIGTAKPYNAWDDGYPSGGNFWSDYNGTDLYNGPYQNVSGSDGIGDLPYIIDTNNVDHYPLMHPYPFHEIALLNLTILNRYLDLNETVHISVVLKNWGHFNETFAVYLNYTRFYDPQIGTQLVTLAPNEQIVLNFTWTPNMTGRYQIVAYTSEIPGDIDPNSNKMEIVIYVKAETMGSRGGRGFRKSLLR
ncbi:hypothetical protein DRH29_04520 [candidate division Kazan bacterium]|uniref:Periplasmic copper-binding protein NosD beta helix domain-containing protein n=1 Tax=candidate division Kazan bacterium TaxID=2202143 RepID=A0A420ZBV4_UNCK3|nr:MAG: hypothetical protein DRH29_04520 [candidate division Kazan bacterium]